MNIKSAEGVLSDKPPTLQEAEEFHTITQAVAKALKLEPDDVQALMWYFEHKLYEVHGVGDKALSYSEVAGIVKDRYGHLRTGKNAGKSGQAPKGKENANTQRLPKSIQKSLDLNTPF